MTDEQLEQEMRKLFKNYFWDDESIYTCILDAVKSKAAAQYHAPKWTPITERLPEVGAIVLCLNGPRRFIAEFKIGGHFQELHLEKTVTHWMPLPTINTE